MYSIPLHPDSLLFRFKTPFNSHLRIKRRSEPFLLHLRQLRGSLYDRWRQGVRYEKLSKGVSTQPERYECDRRAEEIKAKKPLQVCTQVHFSRRVLTSTWQSRQPGQVVERIGVLFRAGGHTEVVDLPATHHGPAHVTRADREAILARRERFPHADLEDSAFYLHR
jgi:hypothetical protein